MRIMSWNVAGLRACLKKGFADVVDAYDPDVICLQEVKAFPSQVDLTRLGNYIPVWNPAKRPGYSGTMMLTKFSFMDFCTGFGFPEHEDEGRSITADLGPAYLVTSYTPNSQSGLVRLPYRLQWEEDFQTWLHVLDEKKPVILCGDLNVAHTPIDIARPESNMYSPGFSKEERQEMTRLLESGFIDTFRYLNPDVRNAYTYWTYIGNARGNNVGWRLDYFIVSQRIMECVVNSTMLTDVYGSDHCPILLDINL